MRLYSYVVARDFGFAPNPFFGFCTLATCKPGIRRSAEIGDWIIGTGSAAKCLAGQVVYGMRVTEAMTFEEYWNDARFRAKRPSLFGSKKQAYGDNIYHRTQNGEWAQEDSHHSFPEGIANPVNVEHDTKVDRVLISEHFVYWGGEGPKIPARFRDYDGVDICLSRQGHRCNYPDGLADDFVEWLQSLGVSGYAGRPQAW